MKTNKLFSGVLTAALLLSTLTACSSTEVSPSGDVQAGGELQEKAAQYKHDEKLMQTLQQRSEKVKSAGCSRGFIHYVEYDENGEPRTAPVKLAELLKMSDLVVIGEFVGEAKGGFALTDSRDSVPSAKISPSSINQLRIIEVLQGDAKPGETISVLNDYAIEDGVFESCISGMTPMNQGDRWIYFLKRDGSAKESSKRYSDHELSPIIAEYGHDVYAMSTITDSRYPVPDSTIKQSAESFTRNGQTTLKYGEEIFTAPKSIDTSSLGVLYRDDFNFGLYTDIINHFQIEPQNWQNPGQRFDEKLIEMLQD